MALTEPLYLIRSILFVVFLKNLVFRNFSVNLYLKNLLAEANCLQGIRCLCTKRSKVITSLIG